jgi:hypothetical protein
MQMIHDLAGKPAPKSLLENIPRLVSAYYSFKPDVSDPAQKVAFGTSGHRGSSLRNSFNEDHILPVSCLKRNRKSLIELYVKTSYIYRVSPHVRSTHLQDLSELQYQSDSFISLLSCR